MKSDRADLALRVRPYEPDDEPRVLELLRAAMGPGPAGERTSPFFRWKHEENPFGRSFMLVGEVDDRIVGFRAFMRWRFRAGSVEVPAVTAVDTATHPEFQGFGVFSTLTQAALQELPRSADLVFNTPNEKSLPGYLKMGWSVVDRIPVGIRIRRPLRFARGFRSWRSGHAADLRGQPAVDAETAAVALEDEGVEDLLRRTLVSDTRLTTDRCLEYLDWRYASPPGLDYRAIRIHTEGRLTGIGLFRLRPRGVLWEAAVVEAITMPDDTEVARQILRGVAATAGVDHLTSRFPSRSAPARASLRAGYVPIRGITFVVNPLREGLAQDPRSPAAWALTLGDLEVF